MTTHETELFVIRSRKTIFSIQEQAKNECAKLLKEELGGSLIFDWENGDAPSFPSVTFDDDITDAYNSRIYLDGDTLKADLHAYYIGEDISDVLLEEEYEVDYLDILECINNYRDDFYSNN